MRTFNAVSIAGLAICLVATAADAQSTRTWVSGVGNDINPCTRAAPCQTFAGALAKTFINGEINCLDAGGFGAVTIEKSVTIDCQNVFASILAATATGIVINIPTSADDPLRTVRLRNINLNAVQSGTRGGIHGVHIQGARAVFIEDMTITGFNERGVFDQRGGSVRLYIKNTTIRDSGQSGLVVIPFFTIGTATPDVVVEDSQFIGNVGAGIAITNSTSVSVKRSVLAGNGTGIDAEGRPGPTLLVDDSQITGNGVGYFESGAGNIRVSNTEFSFNAALGTGQLNTYTNNRFTENGAGGTIVVIGAVTNPSGQQ